MPVCNQCGKPAIKVLMGNPLCVSCLASLQNAETGWVGANNDRGRLLAAHHNQILDQADNRYGMGIGNSLKMQIPAASQQHSTIHNVTVQNSTVGAINTGEAHNIIVAIRNIEGESPDLAKALENFFTELTNTPIDQAQKDEMAEQLGVLSEELAKPKETRRRVVISPMLDGLSKAVAVSAGLVDLWYKLHPLLELASRK